ncbi:MAG: hypothetical protein V7750_05340 [Sneathiella sp.]
MKKQTENLHNVIRPIRPAFRQISKTVEIRSNQFDLPIGMRAILELIYDMVHKQPPAGAIIISGTTIYSAQRE